MAGLAAADRSGPNLALMPTPDIHQDQFPSRYPFTLCRDNGYYTESIVIGQSLEWVFSGIRREQKTFVDNGEGVSSSGSEYYTFWIWNSGPTVMTGSGELCTIAPGGLIDQSTGVNLDMSTYGIDRDCRWKGTLTIVDEDTLKWALLPLNSPASVVSETTYTETGRWAGGPHSFGWGWPPTEIITDQRMWYPHGIVVYSARKIT